MKPAELSMDAKRADRPKHHHVHDQRPWPPRSVVTILVDQHVPLEGLYTSMEPAKLPMDANGADRPDHHHV